MVVDREQVDNSINNNNNTTTTINKSNSNSSSVFERSIEPSISCDESISSSDTNDNKKRKKPKHFLTPGKVVKSKPVLSAQRPARLFARLFSCHSLPPKEKHSIFRVDSSTSDDVHVAAGGTVETASLHSESPDRPQHHDADVKQAVADSERTAFTTTTTTTATTATTVPTLHSTETFQDVRDISSPPPIHRKLAVEEEEEQNKNTEKEHPMAMGPSSSHPTDENAETEKEATTENPTKVPLPQSPQSSQKLDPKSPLVENEAKLIVPDILPSSPETTEDIYLPQSSSSLSGSPLVPGLPGQSIKSTNMKSPGPSIATPGKLSVNQCLFPHPLPTTAQKQEANLSNSALIDEDDAAAFLPDAYSWEQVKVYIQETEDRVRTEMETIHKQQMSNFQIEAEQVLQEHGMQWRADAEAEQERMNSLLNEEKHKYQQKHHELLNHTTTISELQHQLQQANAEKQEYLGRIAILETSMQQGDSDDNQKIRDLYRENAEEEIKALQAQVKALRAEVDKEQTERIAEDELRALQISHENQLVALEGENEDYAKQVELLNAEVCGLQQELSELRLEAELSSVLDDNEDKSTLELHRVYQQELRDLQLSKDEAYSHVETLKSQLEEMRIETEFSLKEELLSAKAEKVMAEAKSRELQEKLQCIEMSQSEQTEVVFDENNQLDEAKREIEQLKAKLEKHQSDEQKRDESEYQELLNAAQEEIASLKSLLEAEVGSTEEASKLSESLGKLRSEQIEQLEQERDSLQAKLVQVEKMQKEELEASKEATKVELKKEHETELASKNKENEELTSKLQASEKEIEGLKMSLVELQKLINKGNKERSHLLAQIEDLARRHIDESSSQKQKAKEEVEQIQRKGQERLENLRLEFHEERNNLIKSFALESGVLSAQIDEIEQRQQEELASARAEVKKEYQAEIENLRAELEKAREQFEVEKKEILATTAKERDELEDQMKEMRLLHEEEFDTTRRQARDELDKQTLLVQEKLSIAAEKFKNEKQAMEESFQKEREEFKRKVEEAEQEYDQKLKEAEQKLKEKAEKDLADMEERVYASTIESKSSFETCVKDMQDKHKAEVDNVESNAKKEIEELQKRFKEMQENHKQELEAIRTKAKKEIAEYEQKIEEITAELQEEQGKADWTKELEAKLKELRANHEKELETVRSQTRGQMEKELRVLEEHIASMDASDGNLLEKVADLEAKTEADRMEYERKVREVRIEHDKEITEMLAQLDLVEAEHNERYVEKEKVVKEKDAVISALGSQLADAQTRLADLAKQREALSSTLEQTKEAAESARSELGNKSKEIEQLNANHQKAMEAELVLRQEACDAAREEMIERAELQFAQANQTYKKLKHEYDTSIARITSLEQELQDAKTEVDATKQLQESREVDLTDQLAQTKANMATIEANASGKVKQYRQELECAREELAAMQLRLEEAQTTSRTVQTTLANVVAEKERLINEHEEMKAVCEELMAMVEGGHQ